MLTDVTAETAMGTSDSGLARRVAVTMMSSPALLSCTASSTDALARGSASCARAGAAKTALALHSSSDMVEIRARLIMVVLP